MNVQEGDVVVFQRALFGDTIVEEGEVVETPPWSKKVGDEVLSHTDSVKLRLNPDGTLPTYTTAKLDSLLEVNP
jgi:hypothetical protein